MLYEPAVGMEGTLLHELWRYHEAGLTRLGAVLLANALGMLPGPMRVFFVALWCYGLCKHIQIWPLNTLKLRRKLYWTPCIVLFCIDVLCKAGGGDHKVVNFSSCYLAAPRKRHKAVKQKFIDKPSALLNFFIFMFYLFF